MGKVLNRRDQLRGEYEGWYQHECQFRPECRPRRGARGSGLAQVLIQTQVHSPRGWSFFYQIFQYLKRGFKLIYLQCLLLCQSWEEPLADSVCHMLHHSTAQTTVQTASTDLRFTTCINKIHMYLILQFHS